MASREWQVGSGKWGVASGEWQVGSGKWGMASGEWQVASRGWQVGSGKWGVASGMGPVGSGEINNDNSKLYIVSDSTCHCPLATPATDQERDSYSLLYPFF